VIDQLRQRIAAIENDGTLREDTNFSGRAAALDALDFAIIDQIDALFQAQPVDELVALKQRAARLFRRLAAVDERLFRRLRAGIRSGALRGTALAAMIDSYVRLGEANGGEMRAPGYDNLDIFVNGLLNIRALPAERKQREPEMVSYQQTPARIIFELAERAGLTSSDVFFDIGSGLGHVPMLVALLSEARTVGIEFEPAYYEYARARAVELNLARVAFVNSDAREADYAEGTVFFLYTPFRGTILHNVLAKLRRVAERRSIRLFTYGPCTLAVIEQGWLVHTNINDADIDKLAIFTSR
jgi:hypothetical protein